MSNLYYEAGKLGALTKLGLDMLPDLPIDYEEVLSDPNVPEQAKLELLHDIRKQQAGHTVAPASEYKSHARKVLGLGGAGIGSAAGANLGIARGGVKGLGIGALLGGGLGGGLGYASGGSVGDLVHGAELAEQERAFEDLENPLLMRRTLSPYLDNARKAEPGDYEDTRENLSEAVQEHHSAFKDKP